MSEIKKLSKIFTIPNELGLHARAAAKFVKVAGDFESEVFVTKGSRTVNGKSIMGLLLLAAAKGTQITLATEGSDAAEAIQALEKLINEKFGEK